MTVAEQFSTVFGSRATHWQPITKGRGSRIAGKIELHHRLKWSETEEPMLLFFNTCKHTLRTLPNMVLDENNLEDVESDNQEDHSYDSVRYAVSSRPLTPQRLENDNLTDIQKHKKKLLEKKKQNRFRVI